MTRPPKDIEQQQPAGERPTERTPITVPRVAEMKRAGEPIVMVTAYDFPSAQVAEEAGVDIVLVGDTAAMVVLGHDSTPPVGMDEMLMLASRRPARPEDAAAGRRPALRLLRAVERAGGRERPAVRQGGRLRRGQARARRDLGRAGARDHPLGHPGDGPRRADAADRLRLGGFKAQGRTAEAAAKVAEEALALQSVGCFAVVFEAVPAAVTEALMPHLEVPVIGIGAGPACDGQVLVFHDLLGIYAGHTPRFVRRYAEVREEMVKGVSAYTEDVRAGSFPAEEHTYSIDPEELEEFKRYLADESLAGSNTPWDW